MTTATRPYMPQAGSLPSNVVGFFQNNRHEFLNLDDIADKFSATRNNIHTILRPAVDAGLLVRDRDEDGDYIYKPGPELPRPADGVNIDRAHKPSAQAAPIKTPATRAHKHIDIDALVVEKDVPLVTGNAAKGACKWDPLFAKLKNKGESIAFDASFGPAVAAAARKNKLHKPGTFRLAKVSADQYRIWRMV